MIGLKFTDISPVIVWAGTTTYMVWAYFRGERTKREEFRRQDALEADRKAAALLKDVRDEEHQDLTDANDRAAGWKADALEWERRYRELRSLVDAGTFTQPPRKRTDPK